MEGLDPKDKLVKNYVRESSRFVECWEFEDESGNYYTICQDQDGDEWIEE